MREVGPTPERLSFHGILAPHVKSTRPHLKHKGKKDWIKGAVKHPGALRATAKAKGLISGKQKLSSGDLGILARSPDPTTRKRAALAKTFKGFNR